MSSIVIAGDTSGTVTLQAPAVAGSTTVNLPSTPGNNGASAVVTTNASGNLGLGVTPSAWSTAAKALQIGAQGAVFSTAAANIRVGSNVYLDSGSTQRYIANGFATQYSQNDGIGQHAWYTAPSGTAGNAISFTQAMTLDASGNLGIGTTSPSSRLHAYFTEPTSTNRNGFYMSTSATNSEVFLARTGPSHNYAGVGGSQWWLYHYSSLAIGSDSASAVISFVTNATERARITSAGNLLVGTTSGVEHILRRSPSDGSAAIKLQNGNASGGTYVATVQITDQSPNNATSYFISCVDSTAERATIRSNGGLANYSANNVNLSDQRLKTDVQLADNYLDKICAIPVKTFLYKDQTDAERNLGVMAQDVDVVAPELIDHNGFGETPEGESPYLSVYQTDLQYALMKCIQELNAKVEALTAELNTLKGQA